MRLPLEILDIRVSHYCACMCSAMAIDCVCGGRDLYIRMFDGFSLNDMSWAISLWCERGSCILYLSLLVLCILAVVYCCVVVLLV